MNTPAPERVVVVGAGEFGLAGAIELRRRGLDVTVLDPGPIPHPLAASADISKVCRMEYGADDELMSFMEEAFEGWDAWNAAWVAGGEEPLYHETGVAMLTRSPMEPGGFEHESLARLVARGYAAERLEGAAIAERFPAWADSGFVDGFFNPRAGYAESGRVVAAMAPMARDAGVSLLEGRRLAGPSSIVVREGRVRGVVHHAAEAEAVLDARGETIDADLVVVAAGAWTPGLVPDLEGVLRPTGQTVFHLRPDGDAAARFEAARFPVFTADIARTGYYGFPLHPREGVVKVGHHGAGIPTDPAGPREVPPGAEARMRAFIGSVFPDLGRAEIVSRTLCLYCDSPDGDFWIAPSPRCLGLVVAAGGSGHGFKFAPVLGRVVADVATGEPHPLARRFRWRPGASAAREAARQGE